MLGGQMPSTHSFLCSWKIVFTRENVGSFHFTLTAIDSPGLLPISFHGMPLLSISCGSFGPSPRSTSLQY